MGINVGETLMGLVTTSGIYQYLTNPLALIMVALTTLTLWSLRGYGGGLFLPVRDALAGRGTFGGGRYLLDTVKGADRTDAGTPVERDGG